MLMFGPLLGIGPAPWVLMNTLDVRNLSNSPLRYCIRAFLVEIEARGPHDLLVRAL